MDEIMSNESNLREVIEAAIAANFPPSMHDAVMQFVFSEMIQGMHLELASDGLLGAELKQRDVSEKPDRNYFRQSDALLAANILSAHVVQEVAVKACRMARDLLNDCEKAEELHRRIGYLAYNLIKMGVIETDEEMFSVSREYGELN